MRALRIIWNRTRRYWLDSATRVVIVDLAVHNPSKAILTAVRLLVPQTRPMNIRILCVLIIIRIRTMSSAYCIVVRVKWVRYGLLINGWRYYIQLTP